MSGLSAIQEALARREAKATQTKTAGGAAKPAPLQTVKTEILSNANAQRSTITVQLFENLYDTKGTGTFTGSDLEVLERLSQMRPLEVKPNDAPKFQKTKAQAPMFNVAAYDADTPPLANRADGSWQREYWAVVGDADAMTADDLQQFDALLIEKEWLHLKTTSFKHTEAAPRVRYVLPLDVPVKADEYGQAWAGLNLLAGGKLDTGAKDPTRRSYLPSCPRGEETSRPPAVVTGGRRVTLSDLEGVAAARGDKDITAVSARAYDVYINADVLTQYDNTPADFELIRAECEAVKWAADPANQHKVSEPYWRGVLGIVKHCAGAEGLAHEVSKHHPDYDPTDTVRKLDGWSARPTTCEYFAALNSGACGACKHARGGAA